MMVKACQQDIQRNLVRGLLALCAFHQGDHAIQKALSRVGGDLYDQPVGEHACPAGHCAAVAA